MDSDKLFDKYMDADTALWIQKAHRRMQTSYDIVEAVSKGLDLTTDQLLKLYEILREQRELEKADLEKHTEAVREAVRACILDKGCGL